MTDDLDTCANCGHIEYHHQPDCQWTEWELLGAPRENWCKCVSFVGQTGDEI